MQKRCKKYALGTLLMPPTVTITADSEGSCSDSDFGALVPVAAGHGLDDLRLLPPGRHQRRPARPAGARRRLAGSVALGTATEFRSAARRGRRCIEADSDRAVNDVTVTAAVRQPPARGRTRPSLSRGQWQPEPEYPCDSA